eukprot:tig00021438_g21455.t1
MRRCWAHDAARRPDFAEVTAALRGLAKGMKRASSTFYAPGASLAIARLGSSGCLARLGAAPSSDADADGAAEAEAPLPSPRSQGSRVLVVAKGRPGCFWTISAHPPSLPPPRSNPVPPCEQARRWSRRTAGRPSREGGWKTLIRIALLTLLYGSPFSRVGAKSGSRSRINLVHPGTYEEPCTITVSKSLRIEGLCDYAEDVVVGVGPEAVARGFPVFVVDAPRAHVTLSKLHLRGRLPAPTPAPAELRASTPSEADGPGPGLGSRGRSAGSRRASAGNLSPVREAEERVSASPGRPVPPQDDAPLASSSASSAASASGAAGRPASFSSCSSSSPPSGCERSLCAVSVREAASFFLEDCIVHDFEVGLIAKGVGSCIVEHCDVGHCGVGVLAHSAGALALRHSVVHDCASVCALASACREIDTARSLFWSAPGSLRAEGSASAAAAAAAAAAVLASAAQGDGLARAAGCATGVCVVVQCDCFLEVGADLDDGASTCGGGSFLDLPRAALEEQQRQLLGSPRRRRRQCTASERAAAGIESPRAPARAALPAETESGAAAREAALRLARSGSSPAPAAAVESPRIGGLLRTARGSPLRVKFSSGAPLSEEEAGGGRENGARSP